MIRLGVMMWNFSHTEVHWEGSEQRLLIFNFTRSVLFSLCNFQCQSELKQLLHEHNQNRVVFFSFHSWKQDTLVMTSIVVQKREDASGNFIAVNLLLFGNNFCHLMFFCQDVVGYNCQESCKNTDFKPFNFTVDNCLWPQKTNKDCCQVILQSITLLLGIFSKKLQK